MTAMKKLVAILVLSAAAFVANAAGLSLPDYETVTLENGTKVLLLRKPDVPMVAARVLVRGGALADAPGKEGSASLLADLLGKGAGSRDALAFANAAESVGGEISFAADREAVWASADFLARDTDLMLELLSDALQRPKLAPAEFEKLRTRSIQSLAAAKDGDPRGLVDTYGEAWQYRGHPYGRPVSGDENTLAALTLDDLNAFYRDQLGGDRTTVAITGDFDPAQMRGKLEHAFGGWRKAAGALPVVQPKLRENGRRVLLIDKPGATQTYFWAGNVGSGINDPAREAQDLVQTVFGGRFTSMLNTELRIKSGLSYGARASVDRLAQPGSAAMVSFTRTDATGQALDLAFATLDKLHKEGVDADTLTSAKRYVLGQFAPDYETAAQLAGAIARLDLYGLPRDYIDGYGNRIEAATPEDVAAARSVFAPADATVLIAIGDASKIRDAVAKYGPVTEMKLAEKGFSPKP
jgi:zinc protease